MGIETMVFLLLFVPVTFFIVSVYILSALGKSLGFRRKYVQCLLYIFEYGRKKIERANRLKNVKKQEEADDEDIDDGISTASESDYQDLGPQDANANRDKGLPCINHANHIGLEQVSDECKGESVARRIPNQIPKDQDFSVGDQEDETNIERDSEFELSDIFEFVHTGIEAIVEDQVTQRFASEELKSWNLLTRTNRVYEFISWRLSFIWFVGFLVRYCIMLPFRVTICFLGTLTLTSLTFLIGLLPDYFAIKRGLNNYVSKFCFRLLSRAFSAIVTYHSLEHKPTGNGICVANHTSPIDVVLLACDSSFALVIFLMMSTALVGCIPESYHGLKQRVYKTVYLEAFEFLSWSLSAVIRHHHRENRPGVATRSLDGKEIKKGGGICVANHTSPIDVLVLAVDQCYDMVGQSHGGFLGLLQRALARASSHIWFERGEMKDREAVARRLKEHVEDENKLPILIFPEGTCINNSAVMQFKKGSFEVGGVIYPVAIKYDARFGDPFWDSSNYSMVQYLLMMMSSWAIVCDVWYLPPMYRRQGESAVDFANRVKSQIARKGGLVDLDWDGQLKRAPAKKEWKEQQQLAYFTRKFTTVSPKKQVHIRSRSDGNIINNALLEARLIDTNPKSAVAD